MRFATRRTSSSSTGSPPWAAAGSRTALDLGCGTGLCGPLVKPRVERLDGVDLSGAMLDRARATGVYDDADPQRADRASASHRPAPRPRAVGRRVHLRRRAGRRVRGRAARSRERRPLLLLGRARQRRTRVRAAAEPALCARRALPAPPRRRARLRDPAPARRDRSARSRARRSSGLFMYLEKR